MVVLDSPFAALQLVGLMLPVVVLTFRAYTDHLKRQIAKSQEGWKDWGSIKTVSEGRKMKLGSLITAVSILSFVVSALLVLGSQYIANIVGGGITALLWAVAVASGFLSYAVVIVLWLYDLVPSGEVDVI